MVTTPQYNQTYLLQQALIQCPGVSENIAQDSLTRTLQEFYRYTASWRAWPAAVTIVQGQDTYTISPVDVNTMVAHVYGAWLFPMLGSNTFQKLTPLSSKAVGADQNPPSSFFMLMPDTMVLYPIPDKNYGAILYFYAAMMPSPSCSVFPTITFTHHLDTIVAGLLWRLKSMTGKPWEDKAGAAENQLEYRRGRAIWRAHAERNYGPADKMAFFPAFAQRFTNSPPIGVAG